MYCKFFNIRQLLDDTLNPSWQTYLERKLLKLDSSAFFVCINTTKLRTSSLPGGTFCFLGLTLTGRIGQLQLMKKILLVHLRLSECQEWISSTKTPCWISASSVDVSLITSTSWSWSASFGRMTTLLQTWLTGRRALTEPAISTGEPRMQSTLRIETHSLWIISFLRGLHLEPLDILDLLPLLPLGQLFYPRSTFNSSTFPSTGETVSSWFKLNLYFWFVFSFKRIKYSYFQLIFYFYGLGCAMLLIIFNWLVCKGYGGGLILLYAFQLV